MNLGAVILAAGKGTRMKSDLPKVAHKANGKPLVLYPVHMVKIMGVSPVCVIIGHKGELVRDILKDEGVAFAVQEPQLGTGHAVLQAEKTFQGFSGAVLVLYGDVPLVTSELILNLYDLYNKTGSAVSIVSTKTANPTGYGRVIRENSGKIRIVEEKDATGKEKTCNEINAGIYIIDSMFLFDSLPNLSDDNNQKEYYLTDIVKMAGEQKKKVTAYCEPNADTLLGVNTPDDLAHIEQFLSSHSV